MTQRCPAVGADPQLVQHHVDAAAPGKRRQMLTQPRDPSFRMEAVRHELQTQPVNGLTIQQRARRVHTIRPGAGRGQTQHVQLDPACVLPLFPFVGDGPIVERQQYTGMPEPNAGGGEVARVVADAVLPRFEG